ncbi:hypothetical protein PanWU01x14_261810 [Parasponia andersonii]|uniref:Uncharacterized protein n=1 Tax=Parasponia andersonii TaxID=3476 RepID=A0A2P5B8D1_PARAD|nr:hypothetical protein PanWU01x14_261810 [Parasponia andersonii]
MGYFFELDEFSSVEALRPVQLNSGARIFVDLISDALGSDGRVLNLAISYLSLIWNP